jgi:hypothetical protein
MVPGLNAYATLRVKLPLFAVLVLRRRARQRKQTLSEALEAFLCDHIFLDEVQAAAGESPKAARAFKVWFTHVVRKPKK